MYLVFSHSSPNKNSIFGTKMKTFNYLGSIISKSNFKSMIHNSVKYKYACTKEARSSKNLGIILMYPVAGLFGYLFIQFKFKTVLQRV